MRHAHDNGNRQEEILNSAAYVHVSEHSGAMVIVRMAHDHYSPKSPSMVCSLPSVQSAGKRPSRTYLCNVECGHSLRFVTNPCFTGLKWMFGEADWG